MKNILDIPNIMEISSRAQKFLDENPHIKKAIPVIVKELEKYFPEEKIAIDYIVDPDGGDSLLKLYVIGEKSVDEMMDRLEKFENEYWLSSNEFDLGKIFVDVVSIWIYIYRPGNSWSIFVLIIDIYFFKILFTCS